jgi:purine/pyrimidine-nucleoside phosphorylase
MSSVASEIKNVTAITKANVYYEGKVISYSLIKEDGSKLTLGTLFPGSFNFNTGAPEKMEIVEGACKVKLAGEQEWQTYQAGEAFEVPGNSSFDISVDAIANYICTFM